MLCVLLVGPKVGRAADSCASGSASVLRTENGIEFRLDQSYPCWQNIDGTYTVVSGSGVAVQSITPAFDRGGNGHQVVDRIEAGSTQDPTRQSLDDRQCQRMPASRRQYVAPPALPITVPAERSPIEIVSDGSYPECSIPGHTRCVATETALTDVATDRTPGCALRFRPPATGTPKPQYCADGLRSLIGSKLPNLPLLSPQVGYGAPVANALTAAIARTLQVGTVDDEYPVVWKSIQIGLDIWGLVDAGRTHHAASGIQHGRVLLILYAWYFLQDDALPSDIGTQKFQENGFAYYSSRTGEPLLGRQWGCIASESEVRAKSKVRAKKDIRWCPRNANDIRDGGHMKFGTSTEPVPTAPLPTPYLR